MLKVVGALLVVLGLALEGLFLGSGGASEAAPLAAHVPGHEGSPLLALGGGALLAAGVLLLGTRTRSDPRFATTEVVFVLCVAAALAFSAALVVGVARSWDPSHLAALALGGLLETLAALGLGVRLAARRERRRLLFVPGVGGTVLLAGFYLTVALLGAG